MRYRAAALRQEEVAGLVLGLLPALDAIPFQLSIDPAPSLPAGPASGKGFSSASADASQQAGQLSQVTQQSSDGKKDAASAGQVQPKGNATAAALLTSLTSLVARRGVAAHAPADPPPSGTPQLGTIRASSGSSRR